VNRLAAEPSPYLRQHADNPVDWHAWGGAAFEIAAREDRPVFLSIGYSACHWCHVMAHESFEDLATAGMLNDGFVSIKVDREERPDVDAVYMEAVQALTGSGGWPLNVFLLPDGRPFYGGTYFPPTDRPGRPSFRTVLTALRGVWEHQRDEITEQADALAAAISSRSTMARDPEGDVLGDLAGTGEGIDLLAAVVAQLSGRFDASWGGFGAAPKFPQPTLIDLALWSAQEQSSDRSGPAMSMATTTLDSMAAGGIHDHLGGGFARYSTDTEWLVPHFEKMLYDQAGLVRAYLHGWQVTGNPDYLRVVERTIGYVSRDLGTPEGGVHSAEDADSEGVEGRFYVWTPRQVADAVRDHAGEEPPDGPDGPDGAASPDVPAAAVSEERIEQAVSSWFAVTDGGNFDGATILRRPPGAPLVGPPEVETGRERLFRARQARTRPGLDDKVLTEWNAMYASALAEAAAATGRSDWADAAVRTGEFLLAHLRRADGRWLRSWQRAAGARHLAFAADYAWLTDGFTRLGELTGRARWTELAVETADSLLALFRDDEGGGFFTTGNDAEALIVRTKDVFDGATPSANAVAAVALTRLGALTGDDRYLGAARETVELLGPLLAGQPIACAHLVIAAELLRRGVVEVVVSGDRPDLLETVRKRWLPGAVLAWGEPTGSPLWLDRTGTGRAYVCADNTCKVPADDARLLDRQLSGASR